MGGKEDDPRSDLDKWLDAQRTEMTKLREELLGRRDDFQKDLQNWTDDATSHLKGPFERFKSFVDANLHLFSDGLRNFPSNISELKARMQQDREARREEELDIWRRWTGSEDSPDHIRMQVERASAEERDDAEDATYTLLRESFERNKHVPPHKILDLYKDNEWNFGALDQFAPPMLSFGGACYYKPETVENLPSTARWGWPTSRPQWLSIDWFKRSPYSPIRLEAHPDLSGSGAKWRAAFEDLLSAALDKPMVSEEKVGQRMPHGRPQSTYYGPGLDWMLSLQCRGILPPQLPSLYQPVPLFDGFDEVKRPRTAQFMHDIDQITSNKSARMYPLVRNDLSLLIDEVAIKSAPKTEAKPLRVQPMPWRVPETEQDLYDEMPSFAHLEEGWVPQMTGDAEDDLEEISDAIFTALESFDADTTAKCLDAYYQTHGEASLATLIKYMRFPSSSSLDILGEALKRSTVPKHELGDRCQAPERLQDEKELLDSRPEARNTVPEISTRPEVLSQLTTTHTTRMPDGSVVTKVVLKKRFADGREEVHESVQETRGQAPSEQAKQQSAEGRPKKSKGWFWN